MGRVLFTSDNHLGRAENLRAVYEAYDGPKDYVRGSACMADAARKGYSACVTDTLPRWMDGKGDCKSIVIGHGITGDKLYALDEKRPGIDTRAFEQIDVLLNASTGTVGIMASQFGVDEGKVAALGLPRTDALVGRYKGDGGTVLADHRRSYLYVPTFRGPRDGKCLPRIDWQRLDELLEDDEFVAVKRHYFQREPILPRRFRHIVEYEPDAASTPFILDCDVVITDYSSIMFDGYVAGKPSVLTLDDGEEYLATRGMYLDWPTQYSSRLVRAECNEPLLLDKLREAAACGMGPVERSCRDLVADMCDGHATERVVEMIAGLA